MIGYPIPPQRSAAALSELTRRVLNGAGQLCAQYGHAQLGLGHVLLSLAQEQRSICARLLAQAGLDTPLLRADLAKPRPATGGPLRDLLEKAYQHAEQRGAHYVGTEHLLLAFAHDQRGRRLLRKYGVIPIVMVGLMLGG